MKVFVLIECNRGDRNINIYLTTQSKREIRDFWDCHPKTISFVFLQLLTKMQQKQIKANTKNLSAKHQSTLESYTHVWPTKQRIKNRENRLLHIVEACVKHKTLLAKKNNEKTFWERIASYLDEKFHFKKNPLQLRKKFINFLYSKQTLSKALNKLLGLCLLLFAVNRTGEICLKSVNNSEEAKCENSDADLCSPIETKNSQAESKIYYSPPRFETLFYHNIQFSWDPEPLKITEKKKADVERFITNHEPSLAAQCHQKKKSIISNTKPLEFPEWYYLSHISCNQYTHFFQYLTLRNCIDDAVKRKNQALHNATVL